MACSGASGLFRATTRSSSAVSQGRSHFKNCARSRHAASAIDAVVETIQAPRGRQESSQSQLSTMTNLSEQLRSNQLHRSNIVFEGSRPLGSLLRRTRNVRATASSPTFTCPASGLDLKRLLTARSCRVPVIKITVRAGPGLIVEAAAIGAICLFRKPFEPHALSGCLEKALRV